MNKRKTRATNTLTTKIIIFLSFIDFFLRLFGFHFHLFIFAWRNHWRFNTIDRISEGTWSQHKQSITHTHTIESKLETKPDVYCVYGDSCCRQVFKSERIAAQSTLCSDDVSTPINYRLFIIVWYLFVNIIMSHEWESSSLAASPGVANDIISWLDI